MAEITTLSESRSFLSESFVHWWMDLVRQSPVTDLDLSRFWLDWVCGLDLQHKRQQTSLKPNNSRQRRPIVSFSHSITNDNRWIQNMDDNHEEEDAANGIM